jgi:hypothetical protein
MTYKPHNDTPAQPQLERLTRRTQWGQPGENHGGNGISVRLRPQPSVELMNNSNLHNQFGVSSFKGGMMLNSQKLLELSQIDIDRIDKSSLVDIDSININKKLSHEEKILSYIMQTGNPYCFMSGGISVRMRFMSEGKSLSNSLINFFSQLKQK